MGHPSSVLEQYINPCRWRSLPIPACRIRMASGCVQVSRFMATILTRTEKARRLAGFAFQAAPMLWRRVSEDRKRSLVPAPHTPSPGPRPPEDVQAALTAHGTRL